MLSYNKVFESRRWMFPMARQLYGNIKFVADGDSGINLVCSNPSLLSSLVKRDGINSTLDVYLAIQVIGSGPKVLMPTALMLEAMEQMDIRIGIRDYAQPFPTMIIEISSGSTRLCHDPAYNVDHYPMFVILDHDRINHVIVAGLFFSSLQVWTTILWDGPGLNCIEDIFNSQDHIFDYSLPVSESERTVVQNTLRACMNTLMLLMSGGMVHTGKSNRPHYERCMRRGHVDEANSIPDIYTINQDVKFYTHSSSSLGGDGKPKAPHWRRGHIRHQRYGVRRSDVKVITILPCMVNAHLFKGHNSDTQYVIK